MANFGFFYIGAALGQREFVDFLPTLHEPAPKPAPALRSLDAEMDALEADLLAAYRPPAAIDRHPEFIGASSTLNEARELDAAGLRYGALLRYLQAALRVAPLRPAPAAAPSAADVEKKLRELEARLSAQPDGRLDRADLSRVRAVGGRRGFRRRKPRERRGDRRRRPAPLLRGARAGPAPRAAPPAPRSRSPWSAGRTPETSPIRQVCWPAASSRSSAGKARFVSENYGDSELAQRFGVTRYPAIFVDDVLVATPNDFGFYGKGRKKRAGGTPRSRAPQAHERFRADLTRMIDLLLAGRKDAARARRRRRGAAKSPRCPTFTVTSTSTASGFRSADLAGRVVLVEFWATWCPPCRGTLGWLGELKKRYGDRLAVVAIAVESQEDKVRKLVGELGLPLTWVQGTPELARSFGDVSAVPTLLLFDRSGQKASAYYGAPPELHREAETKLSSLIR